MGPCLDAVKPPRLGIPKQPNPTEITMKTLIVAATLASAILAFAAPMQAASQRSALSLEQQLNGSFDRRGRGCDTPRDIAEHPRCTKP